MIHIKKKKKKKKLKKTPPQNLKGNKHALNPIAQTYNINNKSNARHYFEGFAYINSFNQI